jgi:5-methylthioribose kinase
MPFEVSELSAFEYLRVRHGIQAKSVVELTGGVSNSVLLVEHDGGSFVLKQSLPQLRVAAEWLCDRSRIHKECAALRQLHSALPTGSVPEVLFEDKDNYLFAMTAAEPGSETWKAKLLRGECERDSAAAVGRIQAALVRCGIGVPAISALFEDQTIFRELRLDPYYKVSAAKNPSVAAQLTQLESEYSRRRLALVHGDWSPKNILVDKRKRPLAIDFEVIHFGDPSFDAAFLLNHLLLKSYARPGSASAYAELAQAYWHELTTGLPAIPDFELFAIRHLGGLLLARIDGKSPAEYIQDTDTRERIRGRAIRLILNPPKHILEPFELALNPG